MNTNEYGWNYVIVYWDELYKLCRYAARRSSSITPDELMSDVIFDAVLKYVARYDPLLGPENGTEWGYVRWCVAMELRKHVDRKLHRDKRKRDAEPRDDEHAYAGQQFEQEAREEVQYILEGLTEYDRNLLLWHDALGLTFAQIGDALGVSRVTAFNHHREAMSRARQRISRRTI